MGAELEQPPEFYDAVFRKGWPEERYKSLYRWIANHTKEPIIDLGCGNGALASLLKDRGIQYYTGIDFSEVAIQQANERGLGYHFIQEDVLKIGKIPEVGSVVVCELLEHMTHDQALLSKIEPGTLVIGSLPSWKGPSHLRCFKDRKSILARYRRQLRISYIDKIERWWGFAAKRI
jgi:2-polyprenyl-3-methyl-5-hydroxy-6-metoxy-1,4-benzoquinol methylase